ncbi:TPA: NAD-dependent epimerase/dehydratase family protein, partial [Enterococcus faecium]
MENILITGGAGFIGSTLANCLAKSNKVLVIDDLSMGEKSNLSSSENIKFIEGSVTDKDLMSEILTNNQFEYIYHLAAIASVADSVARPIETHQVNFESVLMLLEFCRKYQQNLKRLIFSSSAAVYGDEPTLPKKEESVIRPLTPYAIDKFAAEQYVLDYYHLYNVPTSAVRFFNVYGPNQNPNSPYSGVISILVDQYKKHLKNENSKFILFGDGEQSRDFVYIEDVIQALLLIATKKEALGRQFNVGTGKA